MKFSIYKRVFLKFVEPRGTILTILEKEHKKSISMKIFLNRTTGLEEHFCQIILKLGHWPRRRCGFKVFLSDCKFVQPNGNYFKIFGKGA